MMFTNIQQTINKDDANYKHNILRYYEKALNLFVGAESDQPHFEWPQLMQTGQLFW